MSRLDELIQELCPNGVEYKKLGDAVSIERGKRLVRDQLSTDSGYPVFQNSMMPLGYHTDYNYPENTAFIIGTGAAGEIGFSTVKFWAADDCYPMVCGEDISSRYLCSHCSRSRGPALFFRARMRAALKSVRFSLSCPLRRL